MRAWEPNGITISSTKKRLLWAIRFHVVRGDRLLPASLARVDKIVVETLCDEDQIGEAEVDSKGDDGRYEASPDSTKEVGNISYKPDGQER